MGNEKQDGAGAAGEVKGELGELEAAIAKLTAELEASNSAALAALGRAETAEAKVAELEKEVAELAGKLKSADAKAKAAISKLPKPEKVRKVGRMKPGTDKEEAAARAVLIEAMDSGEDLELVFSTGQQEIRDIEPVRCRGGSFRRTASTNPRFRLAQELMIRGEGRNANIDGVALLRDGKQVAYCGFPDPVSIAPGVTRRLDPSIIF